MSDEEFWKAVGAEFERRRIAGGFGSTFTFYRRNRGAPAIGTLDAIEAGRPGRVENLERYGKALNVSMLDVVRAVLAAEDDDPDAITAEDRGVIALQREFQDDNLRQHWLAVGRGLAALPAGHATAPTPDRRGR